MTVTETGSPKQAAAGSGGSQRLDKWLWFTRLVKTRSLATRLVSAGKVRVNRIKSSKPSQAIRRGDVVTAAIGKDIRVLEVAALGSRRGPAPEAQSLYEDLAPIENSAGAPSKASTATGASQPGQCAGMQSGHRDPGSGRPTKRDRRLLDRLRT